MFHIAWMVFCLIVGKSITLFFFSLTSATGWGAVFVFLLCAVPSGFVSWYLYWGGRWVASPISNYFFKNPVAPKKRLLDGVTVRAAYGLAILTLIALPFYAFLNVEFSPPSELQHSLKNNIGLLVLVAVGVWFFITNHLKQHPGLFIWLAKWTWRRREDHRSSQRGDGGDAQFAGFWKENDYPWIPGCLLLGESLYQKFFVGFKHLEKNESDDRHIITMAGSRAGKGISRIIPNLLLWQDNAIIIDPKGENAAITAHNPIRGQAFIIDPYELVKNVHPRGQAPSSAKTPPIRAKYNPLQDIDAFSPTAAEDITVLVEAMVFSQSTDNAQWERTPKAIIGGVIAHVLTAPEFEKERSLVVVYRLLNSSTKDMQQLAETMRENRTLGDYIPTRASSLETALLETKQSFISATRSSLEWLSYPKVQELVGGESDFSMHDIIDRPMSIYLCFDMEALKNLSRFVRIFFLMAFHVMMHPRRHKTKKVLFLMDEFFVLGHLPILKEGAQYIAGEGVKLWPIIQNITMIEELYGKAWTNFTEAAGVIEAFGVSAGDNRGTAAWIEQKIGKSRSTNLKLGAAARSNEIQPLMPQREIEQEFKREDDRSIVFIKGEDPLVLRRKPYWELFHPSMYTAPPQGVPSRNDNGWTHSMYFGSDSNTLRVMGTPFNEKDRLLAVQQNHNQSVSLQGSKSLPSRRPVPGPAALLNKKP